jgi:hypothetical protein
LNGALSGYTTVLNITAGKGMVSKIVFAAATSGTFQPNSNYTIRITVDGGSALTLSSASYAALRGYEHNSGNTTTTVPQSQYTFEYLQPIYFSKSILVEVQSSANGTGYGYVDYALV